MQKVFEKIIERFKSEVNYNDGAETGLKQSIEIVKQEASEYNKGTLIKVEALIKELKVYSFERYGNEGMGGQMVVDLDDAIPILMKTLNNGSGWISVSERLPEESLNSVIGWDEYRERCVFVQYICGRFVLGDDTESVKITHWMDAPYQPKGE